MTGDPFASPEEDAEIERQRALIAAEDAEFRAKYPTPEAVAKYYADKEAARERQHKDWIARGVMEDPDNPVRDEEE